MSDVTRSRFIDLVENFEEELEVCREVEDLLGFEELDEDEV